MKKLLEFIVITVAILICVIPILFAGMFLGVPIIRDWQVKQSLVVIEDAEQLFENTRRLTGSYSQRNIYYWTPQDVSELRGYYQEFTNPFVDVSSNDRDWIIAAWKTSNVKEFSDRGVYIHTDLCEYRETFNCLSIVIIDSRQIDIGAILQGMFGLTPDKLASIPGRGTLIIFTYTIPT